MPGERGFERAQAEFSVGKLRGRVGVGVQEGALNRHRRWGEFRGGIVGLPHLSTTSSPILASGIPGARGTLRPRQLCIHHRLPVHQPRLPLCNRHL